MLCIEYDLLKKTTFYTWKSARWGDCSQISHEHEEKNETKKKFYWLGFELIEWLAARIQCGRRFILARSHNKSGHKSNLEERKKWCSAWTPKLRHETWNIKPLMNVSISRYLNKKKLCNWMAEWMKYADNCQFSRFRVWIERVSIGVNKVIIKPIKPQNLYHIRSRTPFTHRSNKK